MPTKPTIISGERLRQIPTGALGPTPSRGRALRETFQGVNSVHAGQEVEFYWGAAPELATVGTESGALEVYDLAGRRVAVVDLQPRGLQLHGHLGSGLTRPWLAGMYFVRPRGVPGRAQRLVVLR